MRSLKFEDVKCNIEIKKYIQLADDALRARGYTEHSFAHVATVVDRVEYILDFLGYSEKDVELAKIAAYMHDIGNLVNRSGHCQSGALMAFVLLDKLGAYPEDIAVIASAIGNHDEERGYPVSVIAAALMLADKADVRRTRVRNADVSTFDIHDRVNYSVVNSQLEIDRERDAIVLSIKIDTQYSSVMEYFEIFLNRMLLCKKAAQILKLDFRLMINEQSVL